MKSRKAKRAWEPCRVCGQEHANPSSSSICETCGAAERAQRVAAEQEYEETAFDKFMRRSDTEKWRYVFNAVQS